jgi:hypothetical protein
MLKGTDLAFVVFGGFAPRERVVTSRGYVEAKGVGVMGLSLVTALLFVALATLDLMANVTAAPTDGRRPRVDQPRHCNAPSLTVRKSIRK